MGQITTLLQTLSPIVLSMMTVWYVKRNIIEEKSIKIIVDFFSKFAIYILLPIMFFEAIIGHSNNISMLIKGVMLGFILVIGALIIGYFITTTLQAKEDDKIKNAISITTATFGGGNRGMALMLIAISLLGLQQDKYLSMFYAVDFGNFIFLIFFMRPYLRYKYNIETEDKSLVNQEGFLKKIGVPNLIIIITTVLLYIPITKSLMLQYIVTPLLPILELSKDERSFLLLFIAFFLVFVKLDEKHEVGNLVTGLFTMLLIRGAVIVLACILFFIGDNSPVFNFQTVIENPLLVSIIALCVCPPSSFIGSFFEEDIKDKNIITFVHKAHLMMLMVYIMIIVGMMTASQCLVKACA